MRKVVCDHCGADWQIQHYCPKSEFQTRKPTVIWEPDSAPKKSDMDVIVAMLLKSKVEHYIRHDSRFSEIVVTGNELTECPIFKFTHSGELVTVYSAP